MEEPLDMPIEGATRFKSSKRMAMMRRGRSGTDGDVMDTESILPPHIRCVCVCVCVYLCVLGVAMMRRCRSGTDGDVMDTESILPPHIRCVCVCVHVWGKGR